MEIGASGLQTRLKRVDTKLNFEISNFRSYFGSQI